jgi:hypothetical protein
MVFGEKLDVLETGCRKILVQILEVLRCGEQPGSMSSRATSQDVDSW